MVRLLLEWSSETGELYCKLFNMRPTLSTETHTLFGYGGGVYKVSYN
jgi:hypothetical protein